MSAPLSPFHPSSPYSSRPAIGSSAHLQRGPLLFRFKVNTLALLLLVLFRTTSFYYSSRAFLFRHAGMSRDWINFAETVAVLALIGNIVVAWKGLKRIPDRGPVETSGTAGRGTPLKSVSKQTRINPLSPSPLSVPLTSTSSLPSLSLFSSISSPSMKSTPTQDPTNPSTPTNKPRYSLPLSQSAPSSASPPSIPQSPSPSLKSLLASSTSSPKQAYNSSPFRSSLLAQSTAPGEEKGEVDGSPLKVWKMRHSLNKSINGSEFY